MHIDVEDTKEVNRSNTQKKEFNETLKNYIF